VNTIAPASATEDPTRDALLRRLEASEARIAQLEAELAELRARPEQTPRAQRRAPKLPRPPLLVLRAPSWWPRVRSASASAAAFALANAWRFCALALLLQLPVVLNVGYFSHDELQWLSFADQPSLADVPWNAWFDFTPFQFRPLTFNLWLLLSYAFGYHAIAMHFARVLCGTLVALLLRQGLLAAGVAPLRAGFGALLFLLLPEVVFADSWIGTYADSLYVGFILLAALAVLRTADEAKPSRLALLGVAVALCAGLSLLSKEAAITFPAWMLLLAGLRRNRAVAVAVLASGAMVAIYLALRLHTILYPPPSNEAYAWSLANIPVRIGEHAIFPFLYERMDVWGGRWDRHFYFGIACTLALLGALATAGARRLALLLVGWMAALGPILILSFGATHYAYAAVAFLCAMVAFNWPAYAAGARAVLVALLVVGCVHGLNIARQVRNLGRVQHHLYQDLVPLAAQTPHLRLRAVREKDDALLVRSLHQIPSYRHVSMAGIDAVPFADQATAVDYLMRGDGRLIKAPLQP